MVQLSFQGIPLAAYKIDGGWGVAESRHRATWRVFAVSWVGVLRAGWQHRMDVVRRDWPWITLNLDKLNVGVRDKGKCGHL